MLSFFPRGVFDEILNLTESVSEGFPSYSLTKEPCLQKVLVYYKSIDDAIHLYQTLCKYLQLKDY